MNEIENFLDDASLVYLQLAQGKTAIWFDEEELGEELLLSVLKQNGWHRHKHVRDAAVRGLLLLSNPKKPPSESQIEETKNIWWHRMILNKTEEGSLADLRKKHPKVRCRVDFFLRAFP